MKMIDPAVIEFANDAFYLAFNNRDIAQMAELWATENPCVCIHPGWGPLFGRDDIIESWQNIFNGQEPDTRIHCHGARVFCQGDVYSVVCFEQLPAGWLTATNNFVLEAGSVRLVHHQASHCMEPPELEAPLTTVQ